jgi:hypothetical protein
MPGEFAGDAPTATPQRSRARPSEASSRARGQAREALRGQSGVASSEVANGFLDSQSLNNSRLMEGVRPALHHDGSDFVTISKSNSDYSRVNGSRAAGGSPRVLAAFCWFNRSTAFAISASRSGEASKKLRTLLKNFC